jgi:hypothetical protein
MTQAQLVRLSKRAIEEAIYGSSAAAGKFIQGIWMFSMNPGGKNANGMAIDLPDASHIKIAAAFARVRISQSKPDFTILACSGIAGTDKASAYENLLQAKAGKPAQGMVYSFYVQAPGLKPVAWFQHYHRDKHNKVVLDGELNKVGSHQKMAFDNGLEGIDPWVEPTQEERALIDSITDIARINVNAIKSDTLGFAQLFPRNVPGGVF